MGQDQGQVGTPVATDQKSPEEIRRDIEATRHDLGDTAAALAAKTDVKARAKEKVDDIRQNFGSSSTGDAGPSPVTQAKAKARQNPIPTAAIAAFVGGFLFGRVTSR